jgi:NADH:ubiquinone oxidoreductase subunit 6 (subunit J)
MFDYFGVLISIVFGLALTHLLRGLGRVIQLRHEIRPYWVHIVWTINVVIYVLSIWWSMYWWKGLENWSFEWFSFITAYAIAIFMWAYMLFPAEFATGVDFNAYFFANRRWFFGIQAAVVLTDIPETMQKAVLHLRPVPSQYWYLVAGLLLVTIIGLITDKRRVHAVLCLVWLSIALAWLFLSAVARIGGRFA